jgi:hypothetical protein
MRRPVLVINNGPVARPSRYSSIARTTGAVRTVRSPRPPLRCRRKIRCPRSCARCSTSRFRASPTRTPVCASRLSRAMLRRLPYSFAAVIRRRNSSRVSPGVSPRSAIFGRRTSFAGDAARTRSVTRKSYQLDTDDNRRAIVRGFSLSSSSDRAQASMCGRRARNGSTPCSSQNVSHAVRSPL